MTAALAEEAAGSKAASSGAGSGSPSGAPGNPLNAPGGMRRRKAKNLAGNRNKAEIDAELQARRGDAARRGEQNAPTWEQVQQARREAAATNPRVEPDDDPNYVPPAPAPASPGAGTSVAIPAAAQTGSGFLLGLFAWGIGLAYLKHGTPGARQFLAAKFLNREGHLQ